MSLGSMIFAAAGNDRPDLRKIEIIKNQPIQGQIDRGVTANAGLMDFSDESVNQFLQQFRQNTPLVNRFTTEGIGAIDRIYSGGLDRDLAGLRLGEKAARQGALDRTLARITARDKSTAAAMGMPGASSYRDLMNARLTRDANIDAAMQDAAQTRADYTMSLAQKLGNLGTRQALTSGQEGRYGQGVQQVGLMRGVPLQNLAALEQLDQANKWYGLYKKRSGLERAADFGDEGMKTIGQLASIYGSVAGGMGGMCWVAREVYGIDDPRWVLFRYWMLTRAPAAFVWFYLTFGEKIAQFLQGKDALKDRVRRWMDSKISQI